MKKAFLYFILISLLQACASSGDVHDSGNAEDKGYRTARSLLNDNLVEARIRDKIYSSQPSEERSHINVTSVNGIVLLSGEALSRTSRSRATNIARNEETVRRVYNEIRIADLSSLKSRTSDTWITSKVKTTMLTTENFPASTVKVVTEAGTVYLMGIVSRDTGRQAAEIARHITGVKRVVKLFEYY